MADITLTHDQLVRFELLADMRMKASSGHWFVMMLKKYLKVPA